MCTFRARHRKAQNNTRPNTNEAPRTPGSRVSHDARGRLKVHAPPHRSNTKNALSQSSCCVTIQSHSRHLVFTLPHSSDTAPSTSRIHRPDRLARVLGSWNCRQPAAAPPHNTTTPLHRAGSVTSSFHVMRPQTPYRSPPPERCRTAVQTTAIIINAKIPPRNNQGHK